MNPPFTPPSDGYFHIAPFGTFPHPGGTLQVIDPTAMDNIVCTFQEEARQPNFPGLLVDFDHFSHDPAKPSAAAGWITDVQPRPDGLYAKIRLSDLGQQALAGGRYRLASPVWNRADCEQWTAPAPDSLPQFQGRDTVHLRPKRLDRLALTNDPNLPGLMPLTNRKEEVGSMKQEVQTSASVLLPSSFSLRTSTPMSTTLEAQLRQHLSLPATASETELTHALAVHFDDVAALRNRARQLLEAQADSDLERYADVITNRDTVRAQLLTNRESTLALLGALRRPAPHVPLHQPGQHRPNLRLLSPTAEEPDSAQARRIANRARQLQSQLKIGHQAAFRLAEGEAEEQLAA